MRTNAINASRRRQGSNRAEKFLANRRKPFLTQAELKKLGFHQIPERHRAGVLGAVEANLGSRMRENPGLRRSDWLNLSLSRSMNNFFAKVAGVPNFWIDGVPKYLHPPIMEKIRVLCRRRRFRHLRKLAMKFGGWKKVSDTRGLHMWPHFDEPTHVRARWAAKLWPLYVEMLKHVDDPHDLYG